jgi:hypothetical protein
VKRRGRETGILITQDFSFLLTTRSFDHVFLFDTPSALKITQETNEAISRRHHGREVHMKEVKRSEKGNGLWKT